MYTYIHIHIYTYLQIYIYIYIYTYKYTYIHAHIHTYIHTLITFIQINTYIYIYTYNIHIDIYTYTCRVRSEGRQKACRPTAPKMGPRRVAAFKERFKRCKDVRAVLQQACEVEPWQPQAMQRHVYSQRQCTRPWAQPPAPPDIKVDLLPHSAKQLNQESSKIGFCEWQRWFMGSRARFARAYPHTSFGCSVKFAIRIGLAAKLLLLLPLLLLLLQV